MGTNTGIGIGIGIPFKNNVLGEGKPYLPPEIKDSLKAVVIAYGKTNNDSDRAIVKNLVDASNPFVISNAAFKLNSGFGKYEEDFTDWKKSPKVTSFDGESIKFTSDVSWVLLYHPSSIGEDIPSFKVRIKLYGEGTLYYNYITQEGTYTNVIVKSEIFETPICYNTKYTGEKGVNVGFTLGVRFGECSGTITQIPSFEGAFVTDGIDDLITSTKTVQEMLGGSTEFTAVSMIHLISPGQDVGGVAYTNYIRTSDNYWTTNRVSNTDKTGIYGYSFKQGTPTVINNILGDKNDYTTEKSNIVSDGSVSDLFRANFSVEGFEHVTNGAVHASSVAWYWTIIANKVLTSDQINQVIAYFNLDRTLKPDILCNTIKQGITNENHAEFGDKLIDFSGNGRDIQLNNLAWKGDSGIGKYAADFTSWTTPKEVQKTSDTVKITTEYTEHWVAYLAPNNTFKSMKVLISGIPDGGALQFYRTTADGGGIKMVNGINEIPEFTNTVAAGFYIDVLLGFDWSNLVIEQIPSHAGALCLDGVNDFGKVTGMPIYKDYTVVTDREIFANTGAISSKNNPGAFVETAGNSVYSFGQATSGMNFISTRSISYLSKYSYCGQSITAGAAEDGTDMWLGTIRDGDSRFFNGAIYSLMSFPYSMSEFLIERQLKKHKLGTLYPDMVEFRPVITINGESGDISYANDKWENINIGDYINIGEIVHILLYRKDIEEISNVKVNGAKFQSIDFDSIYNHWNINIELTSKSPQKIDITIDEYIRYEDIVQPYPVLLRFKDENGNEVSWGGKFKVGSTITRIGSIADPESNLLNGLYSISGLSLNGKAVTSSTSIVEKQMVFKTTATYLLDNNEPKCILSPRLLRIPNSSYKILGHIPDISGHGNHGKINNSAYALASGANGYPYDYNNSSFWSDSGLAKVVSGELIEYFAVKNSTGFSNITSGVYKGEIKVTGVTKAISENKISRLRIYTNSTTDNELIDITQDGNYNIDIKGVGDANRVFFYAIPNNPNESIVVRLTEPIYIEQVGEYEGAYCLDGVDDFVTIPTTVGGKQVLMKVNWQKSITLLYDQRASESFAVLTTKEDDAVNPRIAYQARNKDGKTYIDGIENNNIETYTLKDITHNITIANSSSGGVIVPVIGCNTGKTSNFAKMSLYDFMLFDKISTDDKIKELNEYVGIEAKVELPPYY